MASDTKPKKATTDEEILKEAKARFDVAHEAESEIRRLALEDLEFRAGKQWPDKIRNDRDKDGRPCLVINRIPQFIQQVTNDQRQNRPSIKVHAVDEHGDTETAKVIQGLIRHIEYNSNADVAYDTAFDSATTSGLGYFRILTDYLDALSFDQEILVRRIRNPASVTFDPHSQEPDGSDANFAFVGDDMSHDEYRTQYPDSKLSSMHMDEWRGIADSHPLWMQSDTVRVSEYFYKEYEDAELVLLSNGRAVLKSSLPPILPPELQIVDTRQTRIPVIKWCKHNAVEVLDKKTWAGKYIPIVPVYGTELYVDGKRIFEGIVRNAKDSQRMYNYWASAETEAIALAPRTPFIAAEGQTENYEDQWASANRRNYSVLKYKPTALNGQPVPPPQRQAFEPAVGAITNARLNAAEDLKSTTGIYDAALGNRSNETSGVAIQRRNIQAQTSNFHFIDNLTRSLRHTGRILIDLIPHIYDTARAARIIGEDGEQKIVRLNEPFEEKGKPMIYDLNAGKYDVTVDVGPSYASKRQEAAASMMEIARAVPQLFEVAGDILVKNFDWAGSQEIAERLKKTLPPALQEEGDAKDIPPQVQAQLQKSAEMVEQLTAQLNEKTEIIAKEEHKLQAQERLKITELEFEERIKMRELETKVEIERAKLDSKESQELLRLEIDELKAWQTSMQQNFQSQEEDAMGALPQSELPPTGGVSPG